MTHLHERQILSHVLIVDDHPSQLSTIHDMVLAEGFHPIPCRSTTEALHAIEQHDIGIAVVDLGLSGTDVANLLNQLRTHNDQLRIIIYTGQGSRSTAKTGIAAGAFAYLEKGGDPNDLLHHIHRAKEGLLDDYLNGVEQRLQESTNQLLERNAQLRLETREHQQTREREASFGQMFDQSLNEIYIVCANTFRFLKANRGALSNLGYTQEELQHMSPCDIAPDMSQEAMQEFLAPLHAHESEIVHFETVHQRKNRSRFPVEVHVQLSTFEAITVYVVFVLDISERKKDEETLANLVAGTASVDAEQFFPQLVQHLASALGVYFASVTELCGIDKASTLAVWQGSSLGDHMVYELPDTPCEQVFKKSPAVYPKDVQARFPKDTYLQTLQAECYLGVALTNAKGEPLGHLSIIDTKPYVKTERAISIMKIFAARASAELLRQKTELEKAQRESLLTLMLNTGPGCIKRVAGDGTLLSMNPAGLALIDACNEEEALGLSVFDLVVPEHRQAFKKMHQQVIEGTPQTHQFEIEGLKGTRRWMETYAAPFNNPITNSLEHLAVTHDITLRKTSESLIHDKKNALERLARGESLQSILEHICRMIEAQSQGLQCSILLLEDDTLWLGAAPSLPSTFSQKINGIKIGPQAGSCGTAAFTKEPVIVANIATDPLWERGHRLALKHDLHACWSTPLLSSKGQVLGTFAMYYNHPKSPEPHDLDLVKSASNLAGIAIERRQNEQALQDTMERFDLAVKGSYDGLWEGVVLPGEPWHVPHTPVWWSPRFKELLGFQDHEFPNVLESWTTRLHPDDKDEVFAALHGHIEQRKLFDVEYRLLTKSDEYRWFSARGQALWDDQGNPLRMAGSLRDITEKRKTEESLKRWASIFEHTQWGVAASAGTSPNLDLINPAYAQMHGYTVQELTGQPLTTVFAPEEHQKIPGYLKQIHEHGHVSFESTHIRKDGSTFPVLITVSAVTSQNAGEEYRIANVIDLTEQKQTELALKKSEEKFRRLFEDAPMGICLIGAGGIIHQTNPAMSTLTGYEAHEMVGQTYALYTHPDDLSQNVDLTTQLFQGTCTSYKVQKRYICKSGEVKWVTVFVRSMHAEGPSAPTAVAIIEDITEQKRYEETLTEMNLALAHAMPGISQIDESGCYVSVNENYANLLGREPSELLGQSWEPTIHPDDLPMAFQAYEDTIQTGKGEFEARGIRKDGSMFHKQVLMVKADPLKHPGASHHCFMRDITDRKEVEEALREQQTFLRQVIDINPNFVFAKDREGRFTLINQAVADTYGTTVDNLLGKTDTDFNPNIKEVEFFRQKDLEVMDSGEDHFILEEKITDAEGNERWLQTVKRPLLDKNGLVNQMLGVSTEITHRKNIEKALQVNEQSIRELYEITSAQDSTFDQKIRALLALGCRRFELPIGTLTQRINENIQLEYLLDPNDTWTERAMIPICDSFCEITLERTTPLVFEDVGNTEWKSRSAYQALGLEAYVGTKVLVGNQVYGSLCFSDHTPHAGKYSSSDIQFLQLMSRWVGGELERKQAEEALQEANERLRTLSQHLLTVQENERRQLARDLHDEIGQNLTAVKINLHTLGQGKSVAQTHGILQDSMQILDSMLKHVRELSLDLRPSLLDDLGLVAAVRWFVNRQAERAGWTAKIAIDETMAPLPPDHATASFRVIQEALTNVMRHAQATHVTVTLQMKDEHLDLLIADNGIGFDSLQVQERSASGQTLGLLSMQERVRFLNGNLSITSQRNQGTQIRAHIPVTALVKDATAS